jgi:hypothetical protein
MASTLFRVPMDWSGAARDFAPNPIILQSNGARVAGLML